MQVLIGCDGVHSVVASWLGLAAPVHSGRSAVRGLAVYPEGHGLQEVHQFVGAGMRAGVVPITDKDVYWFFTSSSPAKGSNFPHSFLYHFIILSIFLMEATKHSCKSIVLLRLLQIKFTILIAIPKPNETIG